MSEIKVYYPNLESPISLSKYMTYLELTSMIGSKERLDNLPDYIQYNFPDYGVSGTIGIST